MRGRCAAYLSSEAGLSCVGGLWAGAGDKGMYARSKFHKAGLGRVELTGPCGVGTSRTSESDGTRGEG